MVDQAKVQALKAFYERAQFFIEQATIDADNVPAEGSGDDWALALTREAAIIADHGAHGYLNYLEETEVKHHTRDLDTELRHLLDGHQ